jgi:hypothetical protein
VRPGREPFLPLPPNLLTVRNIYCGHCSGHCLPAAVSSRPAFRELGFSVSVVRFKKGKFLIRLGPWERVSLDHALIQTQHSNDPSSLAPYDGNKSCLRNAALEATQDDGQRKN